MPRWPDPKKTPPTPVIATKPGRDEVWGLEIGAGAWTQDGRLGIVSGRYRTNVSLRFDGLRVAENFAVADVVADAAVAAPSARPPPLARQTPTASAAAPSQRKRRRSETVETTKANKKPTVAPARQQALAGEMLPPPPRQSLRGRVRQQPSPRPKRSQPSELSAQPQQSQQAQAPVLRRSKEGREQEKIKQQVMLSRLRLRRFSATTSLTAPGANLTNGLPLGGASPPPPAGTAQRADRPPEPAVASAQAKADSAVAGTLPGERRPGGRAARPADGSTE
jgi:hypothetical protein